MNEIIQLAKGEERKSLATLKPLKVLDLVIEEQKERDWKPKWKEQLRQYNLFDLDEQGQGKIRKVIPKLPYKYSYVFTSEGDKTPRKLMIEDWELGALYWNCFRRYGSETKANKLVKEKYFDEFTSKDLYLFLGTTLQYQLVSSSPFLVVGVFFPPKPKNDEPKNVKQSDFKSEGVQQQTLFDF